MMMPVFTVSIRRSAELLAFGAAATIAAIAMSDDAPLGLGPLFAWAAIVAVAAWAFADRHVDGARAVAARVGLPVGVFVAAVAVASAVPRDATPPAIRFAVVAGIGVVVAAVAVAVGLVIWGIARRPR